LQDAAQTSTLGDPHRRASAVRLPHGVARPLQATTDPTGTSTHTGREARRDRDLLAAIELALDLSPLGPGPHHEDVVEEGGAIAQVEMLVGEGEGARATAATAAMVIGVGAEAAVAMEGETGAEMLVIRWVLPRLGSVH
jgi:hypothetical protein